MQVQTLVQQADGFGLVAFLAPFNHRFEEGVVRGLDSLLLRYLSNELQLLSCVVNHFLTDAALDHSVKRLQIAIIE